MDNENPLVLCVDRKEIIKPLSRWKVVQKDYNSTLEDKSIVKIVPYVILSDVVGNIFSYRTKNNEIALGTGGYIDTPISESGFLENVKDKMLQMVEEDFKFKLNSDMVLFGLKSISPLILYTPWLNDKDVSSHIGVGTNALIDTKLIKMEIPSKCRDWKWLSRIERINIADKPTPDKTFEPWSSAYILRDKYHRELTSYLTQNLEFVDAN